MRRGLEEASGKPTSYISSLALDAAGFAQRIRQYWPIENRLHWVKDVVLKEGDSPLCDGNAQRRGGHTITRLTVHIVWVTKYR